MRGIGLTRFLRRLSGFVLESIMRGKNLWIYGMDSEYAKTIGKEKDDDRERADSKGV